MMNNQQAAKSIARRLLRELPAEEVWLFGSLARGDSGPGSDLDLIAVVEESDLPGYRRDQRALAIAEDSHFPKDIIVLTRKEWNRQENVVNTLPYLARKEGILLGSR